MKPKRQSTSTLRSEISRLRSALEKISQLDPLDAMNHGMTFQTLPSIFPDPIWEKAVARAAERGTNSAKRIAARALKD